MEIIWTPWRYEYVSHVDERKGCIFCDAVSAEKDRENLILYKGVTCFSMLNLYPYTTGHLMIAPYKHTGTIEDLEPETLMELMILAQKSMKAIREAFSPDGFNIGVNISRSAGAGIVDHVHLHVVPRWAGDANFMTITSQTRVLPKTLDQVYEILIQKF